MESTRFAVFAEGLEALWEGESPGRPGSPDTGGQGVWALGPNGAGKTTAVRILSTLLRPDGGRAEAAGFDVVRQAGRGPLQHRSGWAAGGGG